MEINGNSIDKRNSTIITDKKKSKLEMGAEEFFMKGNNRGKNEKGKPGHTDRWEGLESPFFIQQGFQTELRRSNRIERQRPAERHEIL